MNASPAPNAPIRSVCPHDCPDRCSLLSIVDGGRLVRVEGNPTHPVTRGFICRKMMSTPERVYAADRIRHPLLRSGTKPTSNFRRISWDEAIGIIVDRWTAILAEDGPHAILPFFGSGTEGLVQGHIAGRRFFNRLGSFQLDRTICTKAGRTGYHYTMGGSHVADPTAIADTKLVIAWGCNIASTNVHQNIFIREARRNGAAYTIVNPVRVSGSENAEHVLQPRPGSDAALALGMMNVIIGEGLHDEKFVRRHTVGFNRLRRRVQAFPPQRVESLTDIPAQEVREFARLYAACKPSFIYIGPGCQRHSNGGMTVRTIACLPALVGAWNHPGGGAYFPTSTVFPVDWTPLEGNEIRPNPPATYNMLDLGRMLTHPERAIKSLYVFNGNPAAVLYNQNLLRSGLEREDLFTVVHERYLTDTARYADIILPATTQFEHDDLLYSYFHPSLLLNQRAIAPLWECRSNLETFASLAAALGCKEPCFQESAVAVIDEILAMDHPALAGITLEALRRDGWAPANLAPPHERFRRGPLATPSGLIELYCEQMATDGFDPLPGYTPPRESREATPRLHGKYPLYFLTPSGHSFLNSNYAQDCGFLRTEGRPTVVINPADARDRGIEDGDMVKVVNNRGNCLLWASVRDSVRPGVVVGTGQWWSHHYPDGGNANATTPDFLADMGGGSAFNTNLVDIERTHPDAAPAWQGLDAHD